MYNTTKRTILCWNLLQALPLQWTIQLEWDPKKYFSKNISITYARSINLIFVFLLKINITSKQQIILEKSEHLLQPVRQNAKSDISSMTVEKILGNPNTKSAKQSLNQFKTMPPINNTTSVNWEILFIFFVLQIKQ